MFSKVMCSKFLGEHRKTCTILEKTCTLYANTCNGIKHTCNGIENRFVLSFDQMGILK